MDLNDVRKFFDENSTNPEVSKYRLQLMEMGQVNFLQELAAKYDKPNPFKAESYNLTVQGFLLRENPTMYTALKRAARPDTNPFNPATANLTEQARLFKENYTLYSDLKTAADKGEY